MTTDPPPRRKWHFTRWLIGLIVAMLGWSGWRAHTFRSALSQAKALGWQVEYADPSEEIRKNWRSAFNKKWLNGVKWVSIRKSETFEAHAGIVHRLNPERIYISNSATLRDLSAFKPINRLQGIYLVGCTRLTNVDALKHLSSLKEVWLNDCTALTSVDGLTNLASLQQIGLTGCTVLTSVDPLKSISALREISLRGSTKLTPKTIESLRLSLPKAEITGP